MNYRVDVNYEYKEVKSKLFRLSLLFALLLTIIIISDILLVTLSKENYVPFMIIAMVISILFTCFSVFFFSNIYSDVNARYRYFKGYESGLKPVEEVELLQISHEPCYENGLIVKYEDVPVMNGLGDSTIWKCTFENGSVFEIEFMPEEFRTIYNNVKY